MTEVALLIDFYRREGADPKAPRLEEFRLELLNLAEPRQLDDPSFRPVGSIRNELRWVELLDKEDPRAMDAPRAFREAWRIHTGQPLRAELKPWVPAQVLGAHPDLADQTASAAYVVVDEVFGKVATIVVEPWPSIDSNGRLRFSREDLRHEMEVDLEEFRGFASAFLTEEGAEKTVGQLGIESGQVLCVFGAARHPAVLEEPWAWQEHQVVDVTSDARSQAKAQYFAAVGPILSVDEVDAIAQEFDGSAR